MGKRSGKGRSLRIPSLGSCKNTLGFQGFEISIFVLLFNPMIPMKVSEGAGDRENRDRPETATVAIRGLISRESCTRCTSFLSSGSSLLLRNPLSLRSLSLPYPEISSSSLSRCHFRRPGWVLWVVGPFLGQLGIFPASRRCLILTQREYLRSGVT